MAVTTQIPSLDALPVVGIQDDLQSVVQVRQKLQATFTMIGQMLAAPSGVPSQLKIQLNNVKFHVTTALSAIDSFLYMGNASTSQAGEVPNLRDAISNHVDAIRAARPAWDNWIKTAQPPEAPPPIPKVGAIDPVAVAKTIDEQTKAPSALETVSEPTPLRTYLAIGGVAVGALLLLKIMK